MWVRQKVIDLAIEALFRRQLPEQGHWVRLAVQGRTAEANDLWRRHFSQEAVARQLGVDPNAVKRSPAWHDFHRRILRGRVDPDPAAPAPADEGDDARADLSMFGGGEARNAA